MTGGIKSSRDCLDGGSGVNCVSSPNWVRADGGVVGAQPMAVTGAGSQGATGANSTVVTAGRTNDGGRGGTTGNSLSSTI